MLSSSELSLKKGHMLHEYRIEATLGVGGFGVTYLATDTNLNLKVAIKEYLPSSVAVRQNEVEVQPRSVMSEEPFHWGLTRFLDESRTLATFRHPNIVRVMRFFEANNTAYMVMDFVEGDALYTWAKSRRPFDENTLRALLVPLLDGLEVVHKGGYLHRDIKPANIFVRNDGSPVLIDFGAARLVNNEAEMTSIVSPGYAPLEQYHTNGYQGPWSDLYALGGVLYWLITAEKPLDAPARVHDDHMPPAAKAGDPERFSLDFLRIVDWMMMSPKHSRPQTVAEVKNALKARANKLPALAATAEEAPTSAPASMRDRMPSASKQVAAQPFKPPSSKKIPAADVISVSVEISPGSNSGYQLEAASLRRIEADLARLVGPIASVVVKSAAKRAPTHTAVAQMVAKEIADAGERAAFLKRHSNVPVPPPVPAAAGAEPPPSGSIGPRLPEARLRQLEAALAEHIGPVARVMVKRAGAKCRTEDELLNTLAAEISDAGARAAFLRKTKTSAA